MPVNLEDLTAGVRTSWLKLSGPLDGVEVLVQYASPVEGEKFRRRMRSFGIMRDVKNGTEEIAEGRTRDYLVQFCQTYVKDWKGVTTKESGEPAPYSAEKLADVMGAVGSAFREIHAAIGREESFFGNGGDGST